jgi:hypothetical protein
MRERGGRLRTASLELRVLVRAFLGKNSSAELLRNLLISG